jgi:serine/threonine-protein kinase
MQDGATDVETSSLLDAPGPPVSRRSGSDFPPAGEVLGGEFRVLGVLGEGTTGRVLLARDERQQRQVAIKLVHPVVELSSEFRAGLLREVRSMARVRDPNVASVLSFGEWKGFPYFVMEYIPGGSLDRWLANRDRLSTDEALEILRQVCRGVQAIHDAGAFHGDLKPGNVLVGPGFRLVVVDVGLASTTDATGETTGRARCFGTPDYLAPEHIVGRRGAPPQRADVYALGVMAFELLTGRVPFGKGSLQEVLLRHLKTKAPLASSIAPSLPAALDEVLARTLDKDPALRPASPRELFGALLAARKKGSGGPRPVRIVIADDDPVFLALAAASASDGAPDAIIERHADGVSALAAIDRQPVDVAIVDLQMPGLSGMEVIAAVRARTARTRFIVVSAVGTQQDWRVLADLGAETFLVKPVGRGQLARALQSLLGTARPHPGAR